MLEFHQPTLADRDWATKCYRASGKLGCENTFTNLFIWGRRSKIARFGEFIIQRFERPHSVCYSYPNGVGDVRPALESIFEDAKGFERPMCLLGMSKEQAEELDGLFPGMFKAARPATILTICTTSTGWRISRAKSSNPSATTSTAFSTPIRTGR